MFDLKSIFERLNSKYLLSSCIWGGPTIHTRYVWEYWKKAGWWVVFPYFYLFMPTWGYLKYITEVFCPPIGVQNTGTIWSGPSWQKNQGQTWVPIFYGRKIPIDVNGSFAWLQNKEIGPKWYLQRGLYSRHTAVSHEPDLQDSIILFSPIRELTKRAKVRIIPLLWEVRLKCGPHILRVHAQLTVMSLFSEGKL